MIRPKAVEQVLNGSARTIKIVRKAVQNILIYIKNLDLKSSKIVI
jgi:hypothetical protein